MAVVDRQGTVVDSSQIQTTTTKDSEVISQKVDFSNWKGPKGGTLKQNLDADAWEYPAPPDMGLYQVKLFLTDDGVEFITPKDKHGNPQPDRSYFKANMDLRVHSEDHATNGYALESQANTILGRGREISTMSGLIIKCGGKKYLKSEMDAFEIANLFAKVIKTEPMLWVYLDWRGGFMDGTQWKNMANSQSDFPDNPGGGKQHRYRVSKSDKTPGEVIARAYVKEWYGKAKPTEEDMKKVLARGGANVAGAAVGAGMLTKGGDSVVLLDDEPSKPIIAPVTTAQVQQTQTQQPTNSMAKEANKPPVMGEEEEMNLLLEG